LNSKVKTSAHVVLGLDKEGKARAALIHPADLEAATKAAVSLGLKIGRADSPQALQMAKQLPDAKIFATGKGLVPLVRKDIYEWLNKGLTPVDAKAGVPVGEGQNKANGADPAPSDKATKGNGSQPADAKPSAPTDLWQAIGVGSVVLCLDTDPGPDRGWWECIVQRVSKDGKLQVRFKMYPNDRPFTVKRNAVAILPPSVAAKASKR